MRWINPQHRKSHLVKRATNVRKRPMSRWTRRFFRGLSYMAVLGFLVGGPAWLWHSGWISGAVQSVLQATFSRTGKAGLRVEEVLLQGREHESAERITQVLGIKQGAPILAINLQNARKRLETLAWVRVASVERHFPNTIRVKIVERQPMAIWQFERKLALIDHEGATITSKKLERFRHLLVVVGKTAPAHAASLIQTLAKEPKLNKRVNAAVRIGNRRWNIQMNNGIYIRLPENGAEAAWRHFAKLERKYQLLKQDLLSIDLRMPGQLIVRTRGDRPGLNSKVTHRKGEST